MKSKWKGTSQHWLYWIARIILGVVFIYAAILKIEAPLEFADSIAAYQILPSSVINVVALGLPVFEFACGLFVLSGFFLRIGTLGINLMLVMFVSAVVMALLRGLSINCGCFGAHFWLDTNPWIALIRDVILLALAVFVYGSSISKIGTCEAKTSVGSAPATV